MRDIGRRRARLAAWLVLLVGTAMSSGCTIRLVADYDEQIDAAATTLQKRMDRFLTQLESAAGTEAAEYAAGHAEFYDDYAVELRAVRVRAAAHPRNRVSIAQYDLMEDSLHELEAAHRDAPIAAEAVQTFRELFNQSWQAIIALEVAKKR